MSDPRDSAVQRLLGLVAMITACAIWGLGPFWIRVQLEYLPALTVCLGRVALGALTLSPFLFACDRPRLVKMLRHPATWLGGAVAAAQMLAYASALNYLRPAEVNLLFQVSIPGSALVGWWVFREAVPRQRWIALAVVMVGVTLVILAHDDQATGGAANWSLRLIGIGLGLAAGVGSSVIQMLMRQVADLDVGLPSATVMLAIAAVLYAALGRFQIPWRQPPDPRFFTSMLLLGICGSGIATGLNFYALRRISLAQVGVSCSTQPVVTILVAAAFGELLPPLGLLGAVGVIGGVIASARLEDRVRSGGTPALARPAGAPGTAAAG